MVDDLEVMTLMATSEELVRQFMASSQQPSPNAAAAPAAGTRRLAARLTRRLLRQKPPGHPW